MRDLMRQRQIGFGHIPAILSIPLTRGLAVAVALAPGATVGHLRLRGESKP
ncbi:MAG: hypothetical protein AAGF79_03170 [Pseudomonadota bacterium]